jgi:di/tripeptidase
MINQDRLVKTFLELVKIYTPSGEEKEIAKEITKRLKQLGAKVEFDTEVRQ